MEIQSFGEYLTERYKNLIGEDPLKDQYKDSVFAMVQHSYAPIGGIHGSGFRNAGDMVKNIPFWKLVQKDGRIVAGAFYKDKGGRKRVAIATDGTPEGKLGLQGILREDYQRAYFEISDRSLSFQVRILGYEFLKKYAKTPEQAATISGDPVSPAPADDPELIRHPPLAKFFYQREIGGKAHTKIMFGTTGKKIIER